MSCVTLFKFYAIGRVTKDIIMMNSEICNSSDNMNMSEEFLSAFTFR